MVTADAPVAARSWWSPHLRGHLLLFVRRPPSAGLTPGSGALLLLAAAMLEVLRLGAVAWLYPSVPLVLLLTALLVVALLTAPGFARVRLTQLGLRPWREWTPTEKSYFVQVVVIANVVFPLALAGALRNRIAQHGLAASLWSVFLPYLIYGFYQELVYRGMVQTELARRWGAPLGILVANLLYTFGPLHWNYFAARGAVAVPMFAAIFAIGLFFGLVYRRSGNLWLVAIFHAIGNAYMVASIGPLH